MTSIADLAAIVRLAAERDCRVLITGDHEQLAAVEGGGGMAMLARLAGFAQLAEPVRFEHEWERDASLRLRAGDTAALAEYEEHGRLRGGSPDEVTDLACRAFLADHLAGYDTLLLARTAEQARELSRRIRDDLIRYGMVDPATRVSLRDHAEAGRGDLITARRNDRAIEAGTPGRWLTNRDVLRVEAADQRTVTVRRLTGRDPLTGERAWTTPFCLPRAYVFLHCDLAYASTVHAAQGRTVDFAHALVDGLANRQWLYVAMSRARLANFAYCVTRLLRPADARPGSRPAPELERARRLAREATGRDATNSSRPAGSASPDAEDRDPVTVLAAVLRRDGTVLSATESLRAAFSHADHLGVLGPIWHDLTRQAQAARYQQALHDLLPPEAAESVLADPACTWLWRSLRQAEATGQNAIAVLSQAVAARSLHDARDIARVLDARVRRMIEHLAPADRTSWSAQLIRTGDPATDRFLADLAAAMDDRTRRIGEHAARTRPAWAVAALGEVPADPAHRSLWQDRAAIVGAYREMYGPDSSSDPLGPEPGRTTPGAWAAWHHALTALGPASGIDLRGLSDDQLMLHRARHERETAWAPPYVASDLRLARLQARTAQENAIRAEHEASAAADPEAAARHRTLAANWQALHARAAGIAEKLESAQETRRQWHALTAPTRQLALAADQELRRRHPEAPKEPIAVSYQPARQPDRPAVPDLSLAGKDSAADVQEYLTRITEHARTAQEKVDYLRSLPRYAENDHTVYLGHAWEGLGRRDREAILQPPQPDIAPSSAVLHRMLERDAVAEPELEAQ
jgi:hypothetical protein